MTNKCVDYLFGILAALCITTIIADPSSKAKVHDSSYTAAYGHESIPKKRPNIVFLVCESTDGRTWQEGYQNHVIPMPNLRQLQLGGHTFQRHYSNTPVCCPSRATFWSGRHAHKIPHIQLQKASQGTKELPVKGVWNNYEGLPPEFDQRIDQVLQQSGKYETKMAGKMDFTTGGHSEQVKLSAWTMYTQFPYSVPTNGGWRDEFPLMCADNGTVVPGNRSAHGADWHTLHQTVDWIRHYKQNQTKSDDHNNKPFFVYQGMNIVHPPYVTNEQYYHQIDPNKIDVPKLVPLKEMHPCDVQSSMMKGCLPSLNNASEVQHYYSDERRRNIRRIYYAMIAEFDAMVGAYMEAIRDIGEWDNTVFIVTSDHGDMQMEHQQSYKMVPYDASSSVPLVIYDGRRHSTTSTNTSSNNNLKNDSSLNSKQKRGGGRAVHDPTQLIDLYPTIMDLAGLSPREYPKDMLDGQSLIPLMDDHMDDGNAAKANKTSTARPDFVVSQFHGDNIAMSWFLVVRPTPCSHIKLGQTDDSLGADNANVNANPRLSIKQKRRRSLAATDKAEMCTMKLVIWGTGQEVDSQLFDLTHDPDEMTNLIHHPHYRSIVSSLEQSLRSVVDYPSVAQDVADYNLASLKNWVDVVGDPQWRHDIHANNLRWNDSWDFDSDGAFQALATFLNTTHAKILPCRGDLVWPPENSRTPS